LFYGCSKLKSLPDISKWNIENILDLSHLFDGCLALQSLPNISKWKTNNVINIGGMLSECNFFNKIT
jgi:surface protein